jgi:hypothetical protein
MGAVFEFLIVALLSAQGKSMVASLHGVLVACILVLSCQ